MIWACAEISQSLDKSFKIQKLLGDWLVYPANNALIPNFLLSYSPMAVHGHTGICTRCSSSPRWAQIKEMSLMDQAPPLHSGCQAAFGNYPLHFRGVMGKQSAISPITPSLQRCSAGSGPVETEILSCLAFRWMATVAPASLSPHLHSAQFVCTALPKKTKRQIVLSSHHCCLHGLWKLQMQWKVIPP